MNLHNITSAYTGVINPWVTANIQVSNGYNTSTDGTRMPIYYPSVSVQVQMQSLTYNDLTQVNGLNIQGQRRALYINGDWEGVVRPDGKGGDLITMPDNSVWLVVMVLENWTMTDGWVKVCITLQNGS